MKLMQLVLILGFILSISTSLSFDWCCELGKRNSIASRDCYDYTPLISYVPSVKCKFGFTVCCSQHNRNLECQRGKMTAFNQDSCYDSSKSAKCDTFTVRIYTLMLNILRIC